MSGNRRHRGYEEQREYIKVALANAMLEHPGLSDRGYMQMLEREPLITLKLTRQKVGELRREVVADWRLRYRGNIDELQTSKLAELAKVKREAWGAFRHRRVARELTEKTKTSTGRSRVKVITEQKDLGMDALQLVIEAIKTECTILGLNAPDRIDVNMVLGLEERAHNEVIAALADILTPQQMEQLRARFAAARMESATVAGRVIDMPAETLRATPALPDSRNNLPD